MITTSPDKTLIQIIGCGYLGQKVLDYLTLIETANITFTTTSTIIENSNSSNKAHHVPLNLDDPIDKHSHNLTNANILYLVPPQKEGLKDLRMRNFIHHASRQKPKRMVLISTTGVYGDCQGRWIDESEPCKPQNERSQRRLDAEQVLIDYCEKNHVPWVILRVPAIYGADKLPIKRLKSDQPILNTSESGFSNRIHSEDLTEICIRALLTNQLQGIYNCSDNKPSSMSEYFQQVARAAKLTEPKSISLVQAKQIYSEQMLSYIVESKRVLNHKLLKALNYSLKYPDLESGLKNI